MRPLRWPGVWLSLWLLAITGVIVLSLMPPPSVPIDAPPNFDKLLHFSAYFALALGAVQLFSSRRALFLSALGLIALGIVLEWAQGSWVPHIRTADPWDAMANSLGVVAGTLLAATPLSQCLIKIENALGA